MIWITGDTHGLFGTIAHFCAAHRTTRDDVMIVLGDACINVYLNWRDRLLKEELTKLPITLLCIHGNHEARPETIPAYREIPWRGGVVYQEEAYPQLLFAKDGEIYDLNGQKTLVIGGAFSVDKVYRFVNHMPWFADEQPSDAIKARVEDALERAGWRVDAVLTHTIPARTQADLPAEALAPGIDQAQVDRSTEQWLADLADRLQYGRWYAGHFHIDKTIGKLRIMYTDIERFGN